MNPSALKSVDSKVKRNKPLAINRMMATREKFCQRKQDKKNMVLFTRDLAKTSMMAT